MRFRPSILAPLLFAGVASAQTAFYTGSLDISDPTFARPDGFDVAAGESSFSYDSYRFRVSVSGVYEAELLADDGSSPDTYLALYTNFDPSSPLANLVELSDDYAGELPLLGRQSGDVFSASRMVASANFSEGDLILQAGTTYTLVVTSYDPNTDYSYRAAVGGGPGDVVPVPEPASLAVLGLGLAALKRRRENR